MNKDILNCDRWNKDNIIIRASNLSKLVLDILKIKKVPINIGIDIINENRYGLEDAEVLTGTKPSAFIFEGERTEVNSYVKMLMGFLRIINSLDDKILVSLAKKNYRLTEGSNIYLSYDRSHLRRAQEIDNTGIFVETNISTKYILSFIKAILQECEIDSDDFIIEMKHDRISR